MKHVILVVMILIQNIPFDSSLTSSDIFNSYQVSSQNNPYEDYKQNHPIYDDFPDIELEQIEYDFDDLLRDNIHKEKIVHEEVLDSHYNNIKFPSKGSFHCINISNYFSYS